ncbi:hypothetical protein KV697_14200 [Sphingomonas sanguinis]|uniref:hypothetical protein n=1 Tax=Sphingomonas sanguinis TaxID=33051 RepID=UPI001C5840D9|nr:hypothetical protein [Sphingomonas sanguinis]QXT34922.1 hypothetical protein KV697_14200 [Sphingomonas sanguinis]
MDSYDNGTTIEVEPSIIHDRHVDDDGIDPADGDQSEVHGLPADVSSSSIAAIMLRLLAAEPFELAGRLYVAGDARPHPDVLILQEIAWDRNGPLLLERRLMTLAALEFAVRQDRARPVLPENVG